jgi:uridine kinase
MLSPLPSPRDLPAPVPLETCVPALAANPLVGSFGPEDWRRFAPYLERVVFAPGAVVLSEATEGHDMFFVLDGVARLRRAHLDLGSIERGDHFGELALMARRLRAASVVAETRLELARLSRDRFDAMASENPALALRFMQALVSSLGHQLTQMTDSVGLLLRERSLPRRLFVEVETAAGKRRVKTGTLLSALLPAELECDQVVAGLINHKAVSLDTPITSDARIEPLCASHWEGRRIFRASLGLLLLEAARRTDPEAVVRLGPSMGFGQAVEIVRPGALVPAAWTERVTRAMREMIAADVPFRQELWTVEEARSLFTEEGARDVVTLLQTWRQAHVPLASCGEMYALSMSPLLPSAGPIGRSPFALLAEPDGGVLLRYGDEAMVEPRRTEVPPPISLVPRDLHPAAARQGVRHEEPWLTTLGITSVGAFNEACISGKTPEIIRVSEGLHEKRIGQIADAVAERGHVRVICVAGPSSSGKTTFIKRLNVQLQVNGIHPVGLSLDDYYLDREKTIRDARGEYDFEALEALDLALLEEHLRALVVGQTVKTARYDFLLGKSLRDGGPEITLGSSDVLVIEGIHGLNPRLFEGILPREHIFRVFIQPMTALPFDRLSRVNVSDVRLLRRIVRDRHGRGTHAAANIQRWPSVRAGERAHIFPFLHEADVVFDSALAYELGVIKVFADRYLLEVPQEHPSYVTVHRLRGLIDRFITIYPDHVPPTSILREFIGGSGFEV